jgi:hypothetical protein
MSALDARRSKGILRLFAIARAEGGSDIVTAFGPIQRGPVEPAALVQTEGCDKNWLHRIDTYLTDNL